LVLLIVSAWLYVEPGARAFDRATHVVVDNIASATGEDLDDFSVSDVDEEISELFGVPREELGYLFELPLGRHAPTVAGLLGLVGAFLFARNLSPNSTPEQALGHRRYPLLAGAGAALAAGSAFMIWGRYKIPESPEEAMPFVDHPSFTGLDYVQGWAVLACAVIAVVVVLVRGVPAHVRRPLLCSVAAGIAVITASAFFLIPGGSMEAPLARDPFDDSVSTDSEFATLESVGEGLEPYGLGDLVERDQFRFGIGEFVALAGAAMILVSALPPARSSRRKSRPGP
jgi:hypothetical protein